MGLVNLTGSKGGPYLGVECGGTIKMDNGLGLGLLKGAYASKSLDIFACKKSLQGFLLVGAGEMTSKLGITSQPSISSMIFTPIDME